MLAHLEMFLEWDYNVSKRVFFRRRSINERLRSLLSIDRWGALW